MSRKRNRNRNVVLNKAASEEVAASRLRMREMGTIALSKVQLDSERMKAEELRWPHFIGTVEAMKQDATVATALDAKYTFIEKAFEDFKVLPAKTQRSKDAAEFVEYCLRNMEGQTLREFSRDAATMNEYGFSVFEKVYTKDTSDTQYKGWYKLKNLAFRPQASLDRQAPIIYSPEGKEIVGIKQSLSAFKNYINPNTFEITGKMENVIIPMNRIVLFRVGGTQSSGMGVSPLVGCYRAWREKILIENLEVVGATKDMGGVIELKIPSQILNKASMDPTSHEAEMVRGLMNDAANAHSGEQSFFLLPSDTKDNAAQYTMTLKGIDGMGKQYSTSQLISDRKKAIFDRFGAGFLNVGNDKAGSYNLSESKQSIHGHFVQHDINITVEGLNENVIPQLLALNGIKLPESEMPKVKAGLIAEVDMESFSKAVQRIGAVGYLPKTPEVINKILEVLGIDFEVDENISQEDLLQMLGQDVSRSGDGLTPGSSGQGTSKISSSRDNSISNLDN